jgi:hypothetical protein
MLIKCSDVSGNAEVLQYLKEKKSAPRNFTVIDVGASMNPWTAEVLDATFDFLNANVAPVHFHGSLNDSRAWDNILEYVARNGKFSYSVCTHTLEDISYPSLALEMLPQISEAGYISMPSASREMTRNIEGQWRGYIHHRWIYCMKDGELVLIPKVPYVEFLPDMPPTGSELQIQWEKEIPFSVLNDDYLGPNVHYVKEMYEKILC